MILCGREAKLRIKLKQDEKCIVCTPKKSCFLSVAWSTVLGK